jgi:multidrug efflux pump subunit AcrB
VNIAYPGASPDTVEREIVNRIEKSLQSIQGVTEVYSNATEGNARFDVIFSFK